MYRVPRFRRVLSLLLCAAAASATACRKESASQPASAVTTGAGAPSGELGIRPVLVEFLKQFPPDGYLISPKDVAASKPLVVDVRESGEYATGFIEGAINIPLRELPTSLGAMPSLDAPVAVVCASGYRSAIGMAMLRMLGYRNARSLDGGLKAWQQAKLQLVTSPVPKRPEETAPNVDAQLQAALHYYLMHTLPADWGAMDPPTLTWDQARKSSAELEPMSDVFDPGRSALFVVDEPSQFAAAKRGTTKLEKAVNAPLQQLPKTLDEMPSNDTLTWACGVPDRFQLEPRLTRYVTVSANNERAAIGMMSMQLLGYHFVNALDSGLDVWLKSK
jgi:rhodanese-related sulfurtransferase